MDQKTPSRPADLKALRLRGMTEMLAGIGGEDMKAAIAADDMDAIVDQLVAEAKKGDLKAAGLVMGFIGALRPDLRNAMLAGFTPDKMKGIAKVLLRDVRAGKKSAVREWKKMLPGFARFLGVAPEDLERELEAAIAAEPPMKKPAPKKPRKRKGG